MGTYLLIGRRGGASGSRRQRRFYTFRQVQAAIVRWRAEGFDTFWFQEPSTLRYVGDGRALSEEAR